MKVSVIVPVYNVGKYLRQCLDSLVGQTLRDIEIICVDDGSTDGSGAILDEYAARDSRIRVVHQANAGAGPARNVGLDIAQGDYLFFADPDDWCRRQMLAEMWRQACVQAVDVLMVSNFFCDGETGRFRSRRAMPGCVHGRHWPMSPADVSKEIFQLFSHVPWNRLLKTSFVREQGLRFQALPRFNDAYFVKTALVSASRIGVCDKAFYSHRVRRTGSAQQGCDQHPLSGFQAADAVREYLVSRGVFARFRESWAMDTFRIAISDLKAIISPDSFCAVFDEIHRRIVGDGDMADIPLHPLCVGVIRDCYERIASDETTVRFLLEENARLRRSVLAQSEWKHLVLDMLPRGAVDLMLRWKSKVKYLCE